MKWITLNDLIISEIPDNSIVLTAMNNGNVFAYDSRRNLKGISEIQKHHPETLCSVIQKPNSEPEAQASVATKVDSSTSDGKQNNSSNSGEQQPVTGDVNEKEIILDFVKWYNALHSKGHIMPSFVYDYCLVNKFPSQELEPGQQTSNQRIVEGL